MQNPPSAKAIAMPSTSITTGDLLENQGDLDTTTSSNFTESVRLKGKARLKVSGQRVTTYPNPRAGLSHWLLPASENAEPLPSDWEEAGQIKKISSLWASKAAKTDSVRRTREELSSIRIDLSKNLYEFKTLLARNGRGESGRNSYGWRTYRLRQRTAT
jgi:hypothetical protein